MATNMQFSFSCSFCPGRRHNSQTQQKNPHPNSHMAKKSKTTGWDLGQKECPSGLILVTIMRHHKKKNHHLAQCNFILSAFQQCKIALK